jgi:hypothetical protein
MERKPVSTNPVTNALGITRPPPPKPPTGVNRGYTKPPKSKAKSKNRARNKAARQNRRNR